MTRPRSPEHVLEQVVRILQQSSGRSISRGDPSRWYAALDQVLANGPLTVDRETRRALQHQRWPLEEAGLVCAELLAFLMALAQGRTAHIDTQGLVRYSAIPSPPGAVTITAAGDVRTLIVKQVIGLVEQVGVHRVRSCPATRLNRHLKILEPCSRLFIRTTSRQTFCSETCRKRMAVRRARVVQREKDARQRQYRLRRAAHRSQKGA